MSNGSQAELGSVVSLWRYPVKSMMGEELNGCEVTERGLVGDRAYGLIDNEDGKAATAKNPRKWPHLFAFSASFAVLLRSLDHDVPVLAALGANAMAFGLGLLAVPVPAGLRVRAGVLVAIRHPVAGAATVVTAAVVQRLAAIAVEIVMLGANRLAPRAPSGPGTDTVAPDLQGTP